jgi:peptidyl-prolyl cis-trans isomerase SurA
VTGGARVLACAALVAALPLPARAQATPQLVDRIVAIVGQVPILYSQLQEEILQRQANNQLVLPTDSSAMEALRHQVLESMIDDEVLYQKAREDTSISVSDADVQVKVEEQVRRVRSQFPSDSAFRAQIVAAHFTTQEEWRRWLSEQQRRQDYEQAYIGKLQQDGKFKPALVTETELRKYFDEMQAQPGQKPKRPATVSFKQIVVAPQPTPAARQAAYARAESLLVQLQHGADFETLARRFSDDPTTKDRGGDLGWFRRGMMVPSFDRAAFALRPGEISSVVESPFGFHIIKVDRVLPSEIHAFHILITPAIDSVDVARAGLRADSVAAALRAGAPFDSLAALYADTVEQKEADRIERSRLPASYQVAFDAATVGQVLNPFLTDPDNPTRAKYVVAILTASEPEGNYTFDDLRDQLRQNLSQQKAYQELMRQLRSQVYVEDRL